MFPKLFAHGRFASIKMLLLQLQLVFCFTLCVMYLTDAWVCTLSNSKHQSVHNGNVAGLMNIKNSANSTVLFGYIVLQYKSESCHRSP